MIFAEGRRIVSEGLIKVYIGDFVYEALDKNSLNGILYMRALYIRTLY